MKRFATYLFLLMATSVLFTACPSPDTPEILDDDTPTLMIKGEKQFRYDKLTCQESFSLTGKEFRVGDDRMSDYFILTLDQLPMTAEMKVTGNLKWTTDDNIKTLKNLSFVVLQVDANQTVWLRCDAENIYVVVRMLY